MASHKELFHSSKSWEALLICTPDKDVNRYNLFSWISRKNLAHQSYRKAKILSNYWRRWPERSCRWILLLLFTRPMTAPYGELGPTWTYLLWWTKTRPCLLRSRRRFHQDEDCGACRAAATLLHHRDHPQLAGCLHKRFCRFSSWSYWALSPGLQVSIIFVFPI